MTEAKTEYADDHLLDLLVDGELEESRRCEVLRALETEPEGWKRCALAFLESQTLKGELTHLAAESRGEGGQRVSRRPRLFRRQRGWILALPAAAALVVAFFLGRSWPVGSPRDVESDGMVEAPTRVSPQDVITLRVPSAGGEEDIQVPLVDASRNDTAWEWLEDAYFSDEMAAALAREGHRVLKTRQFVPLILEDGREAVVPIDELEVHPVSYVAYH